MDEKNKFLVIAGISVPALFVLFLSLFNKTPGEKTSPNSGDMSLNTDSSITVTLSSGSIQPAFSGSCPSLDYYLQNWETLTVQDAINQLLSLNGGNPPHGPAHLAYRLAVARNLIPAPQQTLLTELLGNQTPYFDKGDNLTTTPYNHICPLPPSSNLSSPGFYAGIDQYVQEIGKTITHSINTIVEGMGMAMSLAYIAKLTYDSIKATEFTARIYGWKEIPKKAFEALVTPYEDLTKKIINKIKTSFRKPNSLITTPQYSL